MIFLTLKIKIMPKVLIALLVLQKLWHLRNYKSQFCNSDLFTCIHVLQFTIIIVIKQKR